MKDLLLHLRTSFAFLASIFILFFSKSINAQSGYAAPESRLIIVNGFNQQITTINNPDDATYLLLFPATVSLNFNPKMPSTVSSGYVAQNGLVISKDPNTSRFELSLFPQDHEYYYMAYAEQNTNGDYLLTKCSNLGFIYTEFDSSLLPTTLDSVFLRECPYQPDCGISGVNRYDLAYYNAVLDSVKIALTQDLSSSTFFDVSTVKLFYVWENEALTYLQVIPTTGYQQQYICATLLNKQTGDSVNYNGCRTYQLRVDLTVRGEFTLPNMFETFAEDVYPQTFSKQVFCKEIIEPLAQVHHYSDVVPVIEVPCADELVGAEFWLSESGTDLIQGPPSIPPGVSGLPQSNYWKCSYTIMDPNAGPITYEGANKLERYTLSDSAWLAWGKPHLLWVNYLDRFGIRSKRVPIVLIKMIHDGYTVSSKKLHKGPNGSHSFQYADQSVVLAPINQFLDSINPLISQFSEINYFVFSHYWVSSETNLGFSPFGNTNLNYDHLPDSAVSRDSYSEEIRLTFNVKLYSQCTGQNIFGTTPIRSLLLQKINFEKAIYPPKPAIVFLRDNPDSSNVCLEEIISNHEYLWEYYTSSGVKQLDSNIHGACYSRDWKNFYATNASQYLPNALRYDVRAMSIWRGDTVYSEPVPILIVFDQVQSAVEYTNTGLYKPQTANEDEYSDYCFNANPEPETYEDLIYDESGYVDSMELRLSQIELMLPSLDMSSLANKMWDNSSNYSYVNPGVPRVCYGYLQPGDPINDDRGRTYMGTLNKRIGFDWNIGLYAQSEPLDTIVLIDGISYQVANGHRTGSTLNHNDTVKNIYLYKDTLINPNSPNLCLLTNPSPPTNAQACQSFEHVQVCLGDTVQIGTQNPVGTINPQGYLYDWYDNSLFTNVLSDTAVRLPLWQYHPGMNSNSQFWYYLDTYDPVSQLSFRHCTSVTICPNCSNQLVANPSGISENTLEVYPNPVKDDLHFVVRSPDEVELTYDYQIVDFTGRVILEGQGKMDEIETRNLTHLENGSYYLQIEGIGINKFVVNR